MKREPLIISHVNGEIVKELVSKLTFKKYELRKELFEINVKIKVLEDKYGITDLKDQKNNLQMKICYQEKKIFDYCKKKDI